MNPSDFERLSEFEWQLPATRGMHVPAIIYADEALLLAMDEKVREQIANVAMLPGIVRASYAMPDAHWGYGFPIGGVAAFDPDAGGVITAGGVGFDISCGVRCLLTGLKAVDLAAQQFSLAEALFHAIPAGMGSTGRLWLSMAEMNAMLMGGARWAVQQGYGEEVDLERIEEGGQVQGADPQWVSDLAKKRQRDEMGTLGSGNHYLEVQRVVSILDERIAKVLGLSQDDVVVSIHCGSRGLGHQIGTEFMKQMVEAASRYQIMLPDRELACAPIHSELGRNYLGAMRAAINCALANRQILTYLVRKVFYRIYPQVRMPLLYDVSHNTCKLEEHEVGSHKKQLYIHRKGATRAFGPGHPDIPAFLRAVGQPVLIGGSMGTASYVLTGTQRGMKLAFGSACHGAGRAMSRHAASRRWQGRKVVDELASQGILIRSPSFRGVAEEAPGAYKDVSSVVEVADRVGLAHKVAKLAPMVCIKG
ncbi:MAG: RtcB family protein [Pseudomonadota bacterium]|nr:RtcB family protein [Pseudomonadota bacterium]